MHIVLHPRPLSLPPSEVMDIEGQSVEVFRGSPGGERFPWSYEQLAERLEALPRLFLEPDGSFVRVLGTGALRRQMDGVILDDGEAVVAVELKLSPDATLFDDLLQALDWPQVPMVLQCVQQGVYLEVPTFTKHFC